MNIYTLKFPDDGNAGALRLDSDAEDAADALVAAHHRASMRTGGAAELWQGSRKLCTIRRGPGNIRPSGRFQTT